MITTRSFTYALLICLAFLANLAYAEQKPFTPVGGWEYRRGDSPVSADGKLTWLSESGSDKLWYHINKPSKIPIIPGKRDLWIRLRLENHNAANSAIFINRVEKIFEVYLDTNRIYNFGKFTSGEKIPMMGFAWHLMLPCS